MNVDQNMAALKPVPRQGYGGRLTSPEALSTLHELSRLAAGLGLAGVYGLALGARSGGVLLLRHALGVPLGLLVVGAVVVPSLFVVLALLDAPMTPSKMLSASARSLASTGLVLAGLAPAAAMLVVTITSGGAAALVAKLGFLLAGGIGILGLVGSVRAALVESPSFLRMNVFIALCGFSVIAAALAVRAWSGLLPILGGAS
jgi:hypothetical protein